MTQSEGVWVLVGAIRTALLAFLIGHLVARCWEIWPFQTRRLATERLLDLAD